MPPTIKRKRILHALAAETETPPAALTPSQRIGRVRGATGKNLYQVELARDDSIPVEKEEEKGNSEKSEATTHTTTSTPAADADTNAVITILVELPSRFRSTIWMRRGTYVLVDVAGLAARENKLGGEIVNIVRDERAWRKQGYWPVGFAKGGERVGGGGGGGEGSDGESEEEEERGWERDLRMPTDSEEEEEEEEG